MAAHSKIGASSMERWENCPGSVAKSIGVPNRSSAYAEEGTLAHEHAAGVLEGKPLPSDIDDEMLENIKIYTDYVIRTYGEASGDGCFLNVEQRFNLEEIHPGLFGTADAVVYDADKKILHVIDLKYGKGVPVDVEDNRQLKYYALGAMLANKVPVSSVHMTIVQPRCAHEKGPIRTSIITPIDLLDFAADLKDAAIRTEKPDAPLVPGDWCRWCPASPLCPVLKNKAQAVAKIEFSPVAETPYDPEVLSNTLDWLDRLDAWIKSTREFAYQEAEAGRLPPRYKLVAKRASRKWKDESNLKDDLSIFGLTDEQIFEAPSIKSPAQLEKVLSKEQKPHLESLTVSISSGFTLVHESDKRPAARLTAKEEFQQHAITD